MTEQERYDALRAELIAVARDRDALLGELREMTEKADALHKLAGERAKACDALLTERDTLREALAETLEMLESSEQ